LIEVELGDLKKVGKELAEALTQRLKADVSLKGKTLVVDDPTGSKLSVKEVKLQVKHALHQLGFSEEYRVLTDQHRVRITKVEEKIRYAERGGRAPAPSKSLPYLFPG
jgi:Holliday junction resolvasome RuvABC DNA-binding subunit